MPIDLTGLVRPQLVEMTKRDDNPFAAEFRLQPLERGYGYTLGNTLRRMLLSSLRGGAVWAFRLDGVVHEHQTVPGVVEDIHQIIARFKALTLILAEDVDEAGLHIKAGKAGPVRARDIEAHGSLRVDLVRIDAIYNPVRRANFTVTETRVGQRTDFDRLTLTVETNGAITPEDAVAYGAALLQEHFRYFVDFGRVPMVAVQGNGDAGQDTARLRDLLAKPIDECGLSVRSINSLKNSNINTLGDLVRYSEEDMLKVKNVGEKIGR